MNTTSHPGFYLDQSSALPLYMQLVNAIKLAVSEGRLRPAMFCRQNGRW